MTLIHQIRIDLLDTGDGTPRIWRRLRVPSRLTLDRLHDVLQAALGWEDKHLHEFQVGEVLLDEHHIKIADVFEQEGGTGLYIYDPGDNWKHRIVVEKIEGSPAHDLIALCTHGRGHCPPEDCGGVEEYENILRVLRDPYDPAYRETRRWIGRNFDPDEFSVETANTRIVHALQQASENAPYTG